MRLQRRYLAPLLILAVLSQTACPWDSPALTPTTREIKEKLDSGANYLNAGAKLNRELFKSGTITIETRRRVAKHINQVNGYLKSVVEKAATLKSCANDDQNCQIDFDLAKIDVNEFLNKALTELQGFRSGNEKIDSTLALAVPLIQQAIALIEAVKLIKGA
jgi:hypothetical protein